MLLLKVHLMFHRVFQGHAILAKKLGDTMIQ